MAACRAYLGHGHVMYKLVASSQSLHLTSNNFALTAIITIIIQPYRGTRHRLD